jgi:hypothetical protein
MTNLKFPLIAIVVSLTLSLAAKGEDDEATAGKQNVAPDNGKGEVVAGQHGITAPGLKPIADWAQGVANKNVKPINDAMRDLEKKTSSGDLTEGDGVAVQKQNFDARLAMQNKINETLQQIQQKRDATSQYIASHPGDTKAIDAAKQLASAYNQVAEMGNRNSDKIALGKTFLENHAVQNLPPAPNHVDKIRIPAAMPSELEVQQANNGNKPPDTTEPPKPNNLQDDLNNSYNTEKNIDTLMPLAQKWAQKAADNAAANPDDPVAKATAENAQADLDKLKAMQKNNGSRITNDLEQKYPADDSKPADHAQNNPPSGDGDGGQVVSNLFGPVGTGGGMASDQSDDSTNKFVNGAEGNNGSGVKSVSNDTRDVARDNAKDIAREATRDAANTAREHARPSTDSMRPGCADGH